MTATERLRQLLDERGVKYETYIEQPTGFEHVKWSFNEHGSADFNLEFGEPWLTMYGVVSGPEQAVEATLGRGTCKYEYRADDDRMHCSECGQRLVFKLDFMHYCPNCGRKVAK